MANVEISLTTMEVEEVLIGYIRKSFNIGREYAIECRLDGISMSQTYSGVTFRTVKPTNTKPMFALDEENML